MSDITDRIAIEHLATSTSACTCGGMKLGESYPRHVAAVAEAAVRDQIAAEIEAEADSDPQTFTPFGQGLPPDRRVRYEEHVAGIVGGKRRAAVIARGVA